MKNQTLLVLAAGMGSRYGGLKQIDKLGQNGETIIDYSVYDALCAGFNKIIFVIRKNIEADFKEAIIKKFENKIAVDYVFQDVDKLPNGFSPPKEREKPWGTAHAILMAKNKINDFFAVINGDDFYGRNSFAILADYMNILSLKDTKSCSMVAYRLGNTLSENGTVSRGICTVDDNFYLKKIVEYTKLEQSEGKIINRENENSTEEFMFDTPVSMNFWGFHPSIFENIETLFIDFLQKNINNPKAEFYIPFVVDALIKQNKIQVKVLQTSSQWYGITYREDRQFVSNKFKEMYNDKIYPPKLW